MIMDNDKNTLDQDTKKLARVVIVMSMFVLVLFGMAPGIS